MATPDHARSFAHELTLAHQVGRLQKRMTRKSATTPPFTIRREIVR